MTKTVIAGGARTPIGRLSGGFASLSGAELGGHAIAAALERSNVAASDVDYVIMGQVLKLVQDKSPPAKPQTMQASRYRSRRPPSTRCASAA